MIVSADLLDAVKRGMPVVESEFDPVVIDLIQGACSEMKGAGVIIDEVTINDFAVISAITAYARLNYGNPPNAELLERMYKQKVDNLKNRTGFTDWGDHECE